jgi:hypothetical protein
MPSNTLSPTGLTPQQQLDAANLQFSNKINQLVASGSGPISSDDVLAAKTAILNSGAYPALDIGSFSVTQTYGQQLLDSSGNPVSNLPEFFIPGDGNSGAITPIRNDTWSGRPLLTNLGTVSSNNAAQIAAAQDAAQSALQVTQQVTTQSSAADLAAAQTALNVARARVAALQAETDNTPPASTDPQSSSDTQSASSAANQKQGTEVSSATQSTAQGAASAASAAQQADLATLQAQYGASDTKNTASSSGSGTSSSSTSSAASTTPGDATPVSSTPTVQSSSEDSAANGVAGGNGSTTNAPASDQSVTGGTSSDSSNSSQLGNAGGNTNGASVISQGGAPTSDGSGGPAINNGSYGSGGTANIKTNKLHDYTNWTYRISIYGISRDTINQIYNKSINPGNEYLIKQGGIFVAADGGGANEDRTFFPTDLTIDNVELKTIVNTNGGLTRGTDVITLKFDIIEPYTVKFLAQLSQMAAHLNSDTNFNWANSFFVMKIEFLGYDDTGKPISPATNSSTGQGEAIPGTTKYIPFTFVSIKYTINSSGAVYTCQAIPANAIGLIGLYNTLPFHVEVKGSTIQDLFDGKLSSTTQIERQSTVNELQTVTQTVTNSVAGNNTIVKAGLATALNASEDEKVKQVDNNGQPIGQRLANRFEFEFAQELLNASIIDPTTFKDASIAIQGKDNADANVRKQASLGVLQLTTDSQAFRAASGTRITDFIGSIISVSDYMTKQNTTSGHDTQPIKTWKITPVVNFGNIDPGTGYYQTTIRWVVLPYTTFGNDNPGFGQAPVSQNQIVKQYKYLYSGDNRDVLEAKIDYNMAFFEIRNGVPNNYINIAQDNTGASGGRSDSNLPYYAAGGYDSTKDARFFKPNYYYARGIANRQHTSPTGVSAQTIAVQELMEKLHDNRGDMITLDFTIVGDPDWISQDYFLIHPSQVGFGNYTGPNGSINYNNPVYFNFYFATPNNDYDDTSGLFEKSSTYSQFSGIYRVVMVTSNFSHGKFTQKLSNFRVRNQQEQNSTPLRSDGTPTSPSQTLNAIGGGNNITAETPTRTAVAPSTSPSSGTSSSTPSAPYFEDGP